MRRARACGRAEFRGGGEGRRSEGRREEEMMKQCVQQPLFVFRYGRGLSVLLRSNVGPP